MSRSVYVSQFGGFWKLTKAQWADVVRQGLTGNGYSLGAYQQLLRRPSFILKNADGRGWWNASAAHDLVQPLDWTHEDWRAAEESIARK